MPHEHQLPECTLLKQMAVAAGSGQTLDTNTYAERPELKPASFAGRNTYLLALRDRWPSFWRKLNEAWRSRDPGAIVRWVGDCNVLDDWLLQAAYQTVVMWESDPDGPNARLEEGYRWFGGCPRGEFADGAALPEFKPAFTVAGPKYKGNYDLREFFMLRSPDEIQAYIARLEIETLDDCRERMMREFREQLLAYLSLVRKVFDYGASPQMNEHADWTALYQAGATVRRIAQECSTRYADPEDAVKKAIRRFASDIGLTLRDSKRRKGTRH